MSKLRVFAAVVACRWHVVAGAGAACLTVAAAYSVLAPDRYTATATVMLDPVAFGGAASDASLHTELDLMRSERVAQRVVANLRWSDNTVARNLFLESGDTRRTLSEFLAQQAMKHVSAQPLGDGGIVGVSFTSQDPEFAAQVANTYPQAYGEVSLEMRAAAIRSGVERADRDLAMLRVHLEQARMRRSESGADSTAARAGEQLERLAQLALQSSKRLFNAPSLEQLPQPVPIAFAEAADDAQGLAQLASVAVGARNAAASERPAAGAAGSRDQDLRLAEANLERAEDRLSRLSAESIGAPFPVHLLVAATAPRTSSKPELAVCAAVGAAGGLLIGLIMALLIEMFDRRVRRSEDLSRNLGIAVLGDLPAV